MDSIQLIFTKRPYNPGSLVIRCANPVSFVKIAPASHVIIVDGDYGIEASMIHGVRRDHLSEVLDGLTVVTCQTYEVPDRDAALSWARETAARKAKYDFMGAFGLGLAPDRDWQNDDDWFCFEFGANTLAKGGRKPFINSSRVTAYMLMSLTTEI